MQYGAGVYYIHKYNNNMVWCWVIIFINIVTIWHGAGVYYSHKYNNKEKSLNTK